MMRRGGIVFGAVLAALAVPVWAGPDSSAKPVLDGLIGKRPVIGFTVHGGVRYLGRVLSGDHDLYIVQTFHYVSAPATESVTTAQTSFVPGRNGRLRPVTKRVTTKQTSQKTIADDVAVRALLSGVAGATARPSEQPGGREMIAPSDIVCLQQLSPPPAGKANWTMKTLWIAPASAPK